MITFFSGSAACIPCTYIVRISFAQFYLACLWRFITKCLLPHFLHFASSTFFQNRTLITKEKYGNSAFAKFTISTFPCSEQTNPNVQSIISLYFTSDLSRTSRASCRCPRCASSSPMEFRSVRQIQSLLSISPFPNLERQMLTCCKTLTLTCTF